MLLLNELIVLKSIKCSYHIHVILFLTNYISGTFVISLVLDMFWSNWLYIFYDINCLKQFSYDTSSYFLMYTLVCTFLETLPRPGLAWPGLAWPGLAWPGLAWPGLAWPGLAWPSMSMWIVHVYDRTCIINSLTLVLQRLTMTWIPAVNN